MVNGSNLFCLGEKSFPHVFPLFASPNMSCEECKAKEEGTLPPTLSLTYVTPGPSDKPDLRSIVLAAPCSLALIVKQLRNTFAETPGLSAFQDPQRKPTHTTLVSMDEFNQILKLYGEKPPSNGDEWKAFDETESAGKAAVVALAQHRKAYFEEHGLNFRLYGCSRTQHSHLLFSFSNPIILFRH